MSQTQTISSGLAYDVVKQSLVNVTDAETGTVSDQKPAMRDLIKKAAGNQLVGFTSNTPCVSVQYVDAADEKEPRTYTIPVTRLAQDSAFIDAIIAATAEAGITADAFGDIDR